MYTKKHMTKLLKKKKIQEFLSKVYLQNKKKKYSVIQVILVRNVGILHHINKFRDYAVKTFCGGGYFECNFLCIDVMKQLFGGK